MKIFINNFYHRFYSYKQTMKIIIFVLAVLFACSTTSFAQQDDKAFQEAKKYYEQAMDKIDEEKYEEAILLFDKSIEAKSDEFIAWYNRGILKGKLGLYEESLPDFEETVKLVPNYKKGYLNRGTTKKHLYDYEGALLDYNYAIELDPNYPEAFYNRGLLFEVMNKRDSACADFHKAKELGIKQAEKKIEKCNDKTNSTIRLYGIFRLTKTASDAKYGFTEENPVKVGAGPDGGPANQRDYLELIRDAKGKPIKYKRLGSCCFYKTENGIAGMGMLDQYEITYQNEEGIEKKAVVYISFYDYEEPKIPFGFKTVGQK